MSGPYIASEDSALLRRALEGRSGGSALEIGAGNGGTLLTLGRRFGLAVGTDLVRPGMSDWKERGADYLLADCASCFSDSSFDLVAFNPPYLGGEGMGDRTVDGGSSMEVPLAFLKDALRVVKPAGKVVMLLNDSAPLQEFSAVCSSAGFVMRKLEGMRLFFEELSVFEAVRDPGTRQGLR